MGKEAEINKEFSNFLKEFGSRPISIKEDKISLREFIEKIINAYENGKKYVILEAPCGIGKSVIGYSIARYFGNSYILTSQKVLQEQYYNDFAIPYVLGRSNYVCQKNVSYNCEVGACFRNSKLTCKKGKNIEIN